MIADFARLDVRVAAVVDQLGAAAAHGAVNAPVAIEAKVINGPPPPNRLHIFLACPASSCREASIALPPLAGADSFACVFDNLEVGWNCLQGEDTETVDGRTPHAKTKRACSVNYSMMVLLLLSQSATRPRVSAHEYNGRDCA